jgi:polyisoprenoid-binding protein YceI
MDSMGTGIYFMEGTASADGKTITQKGQYHYPIEGHLKLRGVTKIVDNNTEIFEMYGIGKNSKDMKMMEITYTRKE